MLETKKTKPLTAFKLAMMAVVAIDSVKNLPSNAQYGPSLIFYYCFAILVFFLPSALVAAEMATCFPKTGGAYVWIYEAFGKTSAFIASWIQWLFNVTWAPTILIFIVLTGAHCFAPNYFETHKFQFLFCVLSIFWMSIVLIASGIKTSSYISVFCAIVGVFLPLFTIIILGILWIIKDVSVLQALSLKEFEFTLNPNHLRLSLPLLLSLMGMEMIGVHAGDVENPKKTYPKVLLIASGLIIITIVPASLSMMLVIPHEEIVLTTGVIESFARFFDVFDLSAFIPIIMAMLMAGSFGIFYNWLLTVSRYLLSATEDGGLPQILLYKNKKDMPVALLILQGIVFSLLSSFLILMPSIEQAFWLMTVACSQFGLMYYILLFGAAIKLRLYRPNISRPFQIGKSPFFLTVMCTLAIFVCCISILFGFIPPDNIIGNSILRYEFYLIFIMTVGFGSGLLMFKSQSLKKINIPTQSENALG